jgi:hypothetical protein
MARARRRRAPRTGVGGRRGLVRWDGWFAARGWVAAEKSHLDARLKTATCENAPGARNEVRLFGTHARQRPSMPYRRHARSPGRLRRARRRSPGRGRHARRRAPLTGRWMPCPESPPASLRVDARPGSGLPAVATTGLQPESAVQLGVVRRRGLGSPPKSRTSMHGQGSPPAEMRRVPATRCDFLRMTARLPSCPPAPPPDSLPGCPAGPPSRALEAQPGTAARFAAWMPSRAPPTSSPASMPGPAASGPAVIAEALPTPSPASMPGPAASGPAVIARCTVNTRVGKPKHDERPGAPRLRGAREAQPRQ